MSIIYSNDNPIKSQHIATMRYEKKGYVREPLHWFWREPDANTNEADLVQGVVVEFPWSENISEEDVKSYIESRKEIYYPTAKGPDMFPSSRDYMVYKMFCNLIGARGKILLTNENKSSIFFESTKKDEASPDTTKVANLLIRLEHFAAIVTDGFYNLKKLLQENRVEEYKQAIIEFRGEAETYYNIEVLKYANLNYSFYEWNLIDFIVPKEPIGTWIPDDNNDVKKLLESREKVFGDFSRDAEWKKIYFDLYDLLFDGIVDYNWYHAVGEGWKDLVRRTFAKFREREEQSFFWWERIQVAQIKEKFGLLRIYIDFPSDWYFDNVIRGDKEDELNKDVEDFIAELETYSGTICEMCGKSKYDDPTVETRSSFASSWIKTLCQSCRDQRFTKNLVEDVAKQLSEKN